jgi:hypothetical protein
MRFPATRSQPHSKHFQMLWKTRSIRVHLVSRLQWSQKAVDVSPFLMSLPYSFIRDSSVRGSTKPVPQKQARPGQSALPKEGVLDRKSGYVGEWLPT